MGEIGNPRLDFFTVTSTLDIARVQAERSAPHGTLITASHQTAGRGRRSAQWRDDPGASALMTFVLRPEISPADAWRIPFIASLAGVQYLRSVGFDQAMVKWPNDLVTAGGKVGGLLVEAISGGASSGTFYLLGVGINVLQEDFGDTTDFQMTPTSLALSRETPGLNSSDVINGYTQALDRLWDLHIGDDGALLDAWRAYQMTDHDQRGIEISSGREVVGKYCDVRTTDGAGLVDVDGAATLTAIMPSAV